MSFAPLKDALPPPAIERSQEHPSIKLAAREEPHYFHQLNDAGLAALAAPSTTARVEAVPLEARAQPASAKAPALEKPAAIVGGHFTPRDCPEISANAEIIARPSAAKSAAPRTHHPGIDLYVKDGASNYVVRVHFGDMGDGKNSCMGFNDCKNMRTLPLGYHVETERVQQLLNDLKDRDYAVGKFSGWGVPIWPFRASGSNCGDAFLKTAEKLGIDPSVRDEMKSWLKEHGGGKWAFDRGRRGPRDDYFH